MQPRSADFVGYFWPDESIDTGAGNACLAYEVSLKQELEASESPNENKILEPSLFCKGLLQGARSFCYLIRTNK